MLYLINYCLNIELINSSLSNEDEVQKEKSDLAKVADLANGSIWVTSRCLLAEVMWLTTPQNGLNLMAKANKFIAKMFTWPSEVWGYKVDMKSVFWAWKWWNTEHTHFFFIHWRCCESEFPSIMPQLNFGYTISPPCPIATLRDWSSRSLDSVQLFYIIIHLHFLQKLVLQRSQCFKTGGKEKQSIKKSCGFETATMCWTLVLLCPGRMSCQMEPLISAHSAILFPFKACPGRGLGHVLLGPDSRAIG